jgi:hypothetical protein
VPAAAAAAAAAPVAAAVLQQRRWRRSVLAARAPAAGRAWCCRTVCRGEGRRSRTHRTPTPPRPGVALPAGAAPRSAGWGRHRRVEPRLRVHARWLQPPPPVRPPGVATGPPGVSRRCAAWRWVEALQRLYVAHQMATLLEALRWWKRRPRAAAELHQHHRRCRLAPHLRQLQRGTRRRRCPPAAGPSLPRCRALDYQKSLYQSALWRCLRRPHPPRKQRALVG